MRFHSLPFPEARLVELVPIGDERGFFARSFCVEEFAANGLETPVVQCNVSFNRRAGTLRGLHYQASPHGEAKLVRVTRGAIFDVIVDLRGGSPTFGRWYGVVLDADNRLALTVPRGFAHGFQTLADDTEVFYQMSTPYVGAAARGLAWDDPDLAIAWPETPERIISDRDRTWPRLAEVTPEPFPDGGAASCVAAYQ